MIADIIRLLVDIVDSAFNGDTEAQEKLKDILPERMYTEMVAEAQDRLDEQKFGRRDATPTNPGGRERS